MSLDGTDQATTVGRSGGGSLEFYCNGDLQLLGSIVGSRVASAPDALGSYADDAYAIDALMQRRRMFHELDEPVRFALLESRNIIARVCLLEGHPVASVSIGLLNAIWGAVGRCSRTPAFHWLFNFYGPDQDRAPKPASPTWWFDDDSPPADPIQAAWCAACIGTCLSIIMNHEIAHAVHGHLKFLGEYANISEVPERAQGNASVFIRQCLEWDADSRAAQESLMDAMFSGGIATREQRVAMLMFSAFLVWKLLESAGGTMDWDRTHPPGSFRRNAMGALFAPLISGTPAIADLRPWYDASAQYLMGLSLHALIQAGAPFNREREEGALGDRGRAHHQALEGVWADIYSKVSELKSTKRGLALPTPSATIAGIR